MGGPCGLKLITKDACSVDITHVGSPRGGDTHIHYAWTKNG